MGKKSKNRVEEDPPADHYNSWLVNMIDENLLDHSKILELGSGNGADLKKLSNNYQVTGSDISVKNIQKIKKQYPELEMRLVDVREMNIEGKFDCIYSNKVLSHLTKEELMKSLNLQAELLNDEGIILMTLNYGEYREEYFEEDGLLNSYYNEFNISPLIPDSLRIDLIDSYSEDKKRIH